MAAMGGSVARRYAKAIFAIGVDKGNFELLGRRAQRAGRAVEGLGGAAPDPGEPGVQAVAEARGPAGAHAPRGARPAGAEPGAAAARTRPHRHPARRSRAPTRRCATSKLGRVRATRDVGQAARPRQRDRDAARRSSAAPARRCS